MNLSPLKFSVAISLLVHGVGIGGLALFKQFHHAPATMSVSETILLELVAAPSESGRSVVQPIVPAPLSPPSPIALPKPEEIISEKPVELTPAKEVMVLPDPLLPSLVTELATTPVAEVTAQNLDAPEPDHARGDGSSPTAGNDVTTAEGKPLANAEPNYLKNPEPLYPLAARRRRQEGLVVLNIRVSTAGRAMDASLKRSSGYPLLDEAALTQVREWEFSPARIGRIAVESEIEVPVRFKLTN